MKAIPLSTHGLLEMLAAPAVMAAPFVFGFGPAATVIAVGIGAVLLGLALQVESPGRTMPLSAHAGFDYTLAFVALVGGLAVGLATEEWIAATFLVGVGVAQVMLTAMTRFTVTRDA